MSEVWHNLPAKAEADSFKDIEPAQLCDAEQLEALREKHAGLLAKTETTEQWRYPWPSLREQREALERDIQHGCVFVRRTSEGRVATSITLHEEGDPRLWSKDELQDPALYISRLMRDPDLADEGEGVHMLAWAFEQAKQRDKLWLRGTVQGDNLKLQQYYLDLGAEAVYRPWTGYPAYFVMSRRVLEAEESYETIKLFSYNDPEDSLLDEFMHTDPYKVPHLSDSWLALWREERIDITPGLKTFLVEDLEHGGWLQNRLGRTGYGSEAQQLCRMLPCEYFVKLLGQYGLSRLLVEESCEYNDDGFGRESPLTLRDLKVIAAERPIESSEAYQRAWEVYEATGYSGNGPLVRGTITLGETHIILPDATEMDLGDSPEKLAVRADKPYAALPCENFTNDQPRQGMARFRMLPGRATPRARVLQLPPTTADFVV